MKFFSYPRFEVYLPFVTTSMILYKLDVVGIIWDYYGKSLNTNTNSNILHTNTNTNILHTNTNTNILHTNTNTNILHTNTNINILHNTQIQIFYTQIQIQIQIF